MKLSGFGCVSVADLFHALPAGELPVARRSSKVQQANPLPLSLFSA
ncbi:MAG: hypothetical protein QNJ41_01925 [Xenococcaceae cyanobacterium MO_188.B32]|nr:hypothetical protein [Xenococcaceae cyanobacterium MO_188.B32]